ncbi:1,2-phenylacetyl-CoA epoxidase subunit PaaC [Mycobacterium sp.]|uniref:1,2-phenylacetyl-CoA epoxidase subunit PaaC n=1 Tax=Mycobacterium sp. TaxID=1785 RepID=UPI003BACC4AF
MKVQSALLEFTLRLADNALVLAQRLCEWITRAPVLEEEMALANIAIDLLGHAKMLYGEYVAQEEGCGDIDALIFGREPHGYKNYTMLEIPNGDFARTIVRQLLYTTYCWHLYEDLSRSRSEFFAQYARAARLDNENHLAHARQWAKVLATGTEESGERLRTAVFDVAPHANQLFEEDAALSTMIEKGIAGDPKRFYGKWRADVESALAEGDIVFPDVPGVHASAAVSPDAHTDGFGDLIDTMQSVYRSGQGGSW